MSSMILLHKIIFPVYKNQNNNKEIEVDKFIEIIMGAIYLLVDLKKNVAHFFKLIQI